MKESLWLREHSISSSATCANEALTMAKMLCILYCHTVSPNPIFLCIWLDSDLKWCPHWVSQLFRSDLWVHAAFGQYGTDIDIDGEVAYTIEMFSYFNFTTWKCVAAVLDYCVLSCRTVGGCYVQLLSSPVQNMFQK